jgi:hypothetical protein
MMELVKLAPLLFARLNAVHIYTTYQTYATHLWVEHWSEMNLFILQLTVSDYFVFDTVFCVLRFAVFKIWLQGNS